MGVTEILSLTFTVYLAVMSGTLLATTAGYALVRRLGQSKELERKTVALAQVRARVERLEREAHSAWTGHRLEVFQVPKEDGAPNGAHAL